MLGPKTVVGEVRSNMNERHAGSQIFMLRIAFPLSHCCSSLGWVPLQTTFFFSTVKTASGMIANLVSGYF
jgi:hypothetical protein